MIKLKQFSAIGSRLTKISSFHQSTDNPIVKVKQGKLRGSVQNLLDGTKYYSFKGIPYAKPPIKDLRFQAPLPPKPWNDIHEATEHRAVCTQFDMTSSEIIEGNEDCLYLNIYTKSLQPDSKIPVMVNIHGGGYMSGSGDADMSGPEFLLQHDVVLITFNYRLEVLGFLCLDIPEAPGNAGMKDQVAALRWVQENIAKFGGDPDNVTIYGESAGSSSVTCHMLSPMSDGLFHKVIAQSGTCIHDWAVTDGGSEPAFRIAKHLGKETNDKYALLSYLKSVTPITLAAMNFKTKTKDESFRELPLHFGPHVEKEFQNVETFLSEKPIELLLKGNVKKVPLILGYNSAEGLVMLYDKLKKKEILNTHPSYFVPRELNQNISKDMVLDFGQRIKQQYFGTECLSSKTAQAIVDLQTDVHFAYNVHRFAYFYRFFDTPIYMYQFGYSTELNAYKKNLGLQHMKGASHADDVLYLHCSEKLNKEAYESCDRLRKIVFNVTKLWTDFAKTGNPTPDDNLGVMWPKYNITSREFMNLDDPMHVKQYSNRDRVEFWNTLYREAGRPYMKV